MLIANKVAEKDVRDFLVNQGYCGHSAEFEEIELHAIERPGWLQVFRFCVNAKSSDDRRVRLFGAMKDDERFKLKQIELFENRNRRDQLLADWSTGMTQPKYSTSGENYTRAQYWRELLILLVLAAMLLFVISMIGVQ